MRRSVQDLFQLGVLGKAVGGKSTAESSKRKAGAASRDRDDYGDASSFDAALSLAASMTAPRTPASNHQRVDYTRPTFLKPSSDSSRVAAHPAATPFRSTSISRQTSGVGARVSSTPGPGPDDGQPVIHNLLRHFTEEPAADPNPNSQTPGTVDPTRRESNDRSAFLTVPSAAGEGVAQVNAENSGDDAGRVSPLVLQHPDLGKISVEEVAGKIEARLGASGEESQINVPNPQDGELQVDRSIAEVMADLKHGPGVADEDQTDDQMLDLPASQTDRATADGIRSRSGISWRFDEGARSLPDLRIVARNDNPSPSTGQTPPDLHLVEFGLDEDLATRLAGTWEQVFVDAGGEVLEDPTLSTLPVIMSDERQRASRSIVGDLDAEADLAAPEKSDGTVIEPAGEAAPVEQPEMAGNDTQSGADNPGTDQREPVESGAASVASRAGGSGGTSEASTSSVPLFSDFLSNTTGAARLIDAEAPVAVRQAAMEIVNELRHLQRTSGSELSFNLRLNPEHLGQVEVEIQRAGNVWSISIVAANDEARDALAAEINRLENRFRENNLRLDAVRIVTRSTDEAISAGERSSGANFDGAHHHDGANGENRDLSGWRNSGRAGILDLDSRGDAETAQVLTDSHLPASDSGIDIKA